MTVNYRVAGSGFVVGLVVGLLLGLVLAPVVTPAGGTTVTATVTTTVTVTVRPSEPEIIRSNVAAFLVRFVEVSQLPIKTEMLEVGSPERPGREGIVQEVLGNLKLVRPPFIAAPDIFELKDFRESVFRLEDFVERYQIPSTVEERFRSAVRSEVLLYTADTDWLVPVFLFDKGGQPLRVAVVVSSVSAQPIYDSFVRFIGLFQSDWVTAGFESPEAYTLPSPLSISTLEDADGAPAFSSPICLSYTFRNFYGLEVSTMWGRLHYNMSREVWTGTYKLSFRFEGGYEDGIFRDIFLWFAGTPAIGLFHQPRLLLGFPDRDAPSPQEDLQGKILYSKFELSTETGHLSDRAVSCTEKNWDVQIFGANYAELTMDVSGSMEPASLCIVELRGEGRLLTFSSYAILTTDYRPLILDMEPLSVEC
jgi:hypothetical protein